MTSPGINAAEEQQRLRMDTQDSSPVLGVMSLGFQALQTSLPSP